MDSARSLWFADGERGVLVLNVVQGRVLRLVGLDDATGTLLWERRLPEGSPSCQLVADETIACLLREWTNRRVPSEIALIDGVTGRTVRSWELDENHPVDDIAVTPDRIVAIARDLDTDADALVLHTFPITGLGRTSSCPLPMTPAGTVDWPVSIDTSANLADLFIRWRDESGGHAAHFALDCSTQLQPTALNYRHTVRLGSGWELQREDRDGLDTQWRLIDDNGRATDLGAGSPWQPAGPGQGQLRDGSVGFNQRIADLQHVRGSDLWTGTPTSSTKYRWGRDSGLEWGERGLRVVMSSGLSHAVAVDAEPWDVTTGNGLAVVVARKVRVLDSRGEVVATLPLPADPDSTSETWEPVVTTRGFALLSDYGMVTGYTLK
jgi:hypothetical protein